MLLFQDSGKVYMCFFGFGCLFIWVQFCLDFVVCLGFEYAGGEKELSFIGSWFMGICSDVSGYL